jgi:cell shape-determining protein MreC
MNERWILFILSGIMLAILLYSGNGASSMLYRFFRIDSLSTQERMIESLKIENQTLKNQLNKFQLTKGSVVQEPTKYKNTFVYSQYPLNAKNEIIVDSGSVSGIALNKAVVVDVSVVANQSEKNEEQMVDGVLIGTVTAVFEKQSVVRTLFDPQWKSQIRIGRPGVSGLLAGGLDPKVTLIPKNVTITSGDIIYSVDSRFPFGLVIGIVKDVISAKDDVFQEATIKFAYDPGRLQVVAIQE